MMRQTILQGHSGVLGHALLVHAEQALRLPVATVEGRRIYERLLAGVVSGGEPLLPQGSEIGTDWICASGLVDPRAPHESLMAANYEGPFRLYQALCRERDRKGQGRIRLVTFGSVLEQHEELAEANPYLASKRRLWLKWQESQGEPAAEWHHIQLHTLYGGELLHPFLFLGQMERALRQGAPFRMSDGRQIREYHHVHDIVVSVWKYLYAAPPRSECIDLSSGEPISLKSLSEGIFSAFNAVDLLRIGAIESQAGEVYNKAFERSPFLLANREPIQGIVEWFRSRGAARFPYGEADIDRRPDA